MVKSDAAIIEDLKQGAMDAEDMFDLDELERYAMEERKKCRANKTQPNTE